MLAWISTQLIRTKRFLDSVFARIYPRPARGIPEAFCELEGRFGYHFRDANLLIRALKHRSYAYARDEDGVDSNERLEFLGDAVLDLIVTEYLYRTFGKKREGELTQIKSLVVSKSILSRKAEEIGLGDHVFLSDAEELAGGRRRVSILGDAYEAILGALYLDGGLRVVRRFVHRTLLRDLELFIADERYINYKSMLLEWTQREGRGHPSYRVAGEEGPDHRKMFTVEVAIQGKRVGRGQGQSKKKAQQMAAKRALRRLAVEDT